MFGLHTRKLVTFGTPSQTCQGTDRYKTQESTGIYIYNQHSRPTNNIDTRDPARRTDGRRVIRLVLPVHVRHGLNSLQEPQKHALCIFGFVRLELVKGLLLLLLLLLTVLFPLAGASDLRVPFPPLRGVLFISHEPVFGAELGKTSLQRESRDVVPRSEHHTYVRAAKKNKLYL